MKDLDKSQVYSLEGITEEQAKEVYNWLLNNESNWHPSGHSSMFNNNSIRYYLGRWYFSIISDTTTHISTLFEKSLEEQLHDAEIKVAELKKQIEERDKPKIGDVCKFWDDEPSKVVIGHYNGFENHYHRHTSSRGGFMNSKKLTQQEVIELLFNEGR